MTHQHSRTTHSAALWMLLRCLLITLIPAITHILAHRLNIYVIVFFHSFSAFLFLLPWVLTQGIRGISTQKLPLHAARGLLSTLALILWCYALSAMRYTEALSLSFIWALCSMMMASLWFGERIRSYSIIALIGGITGMLIILKPDITTLQPAALLVIATVILWSAADIIIKTLTHTDNTKTQCFYITFFMSLFTLPLALGHWQPPSLTEFGYLALQGIMFGLSMIAIVKAYGNAPLCDIMPLDFSRLFFTLLIAFLFLHEPLHIETVLGAALILGSTVYCVVAKSRRSPPYS